MILNIQTYSIIVVYRRDHVLFTLFVFVYVTNTRWMVSGEIWTSYNYIYRNDPSFYVNSSDANLCEVQSVLILTHLTNTDTYTTHHEEVRTEPRTD
jgi:hypothetical protein